jgi:hypothetical protein
MQPVMVLVMMHHLCLYKDLDAKYKDSSRRNTKMPKSAKQRSEKKVRTTVSLPQPVYEEARSLVHSNLTAADSMNGFFVSAITAYLKLIKRKQIDAKFSAMADDADFQKEARLISEEFTQSDWESFDLSERST